MGMGNKHKKFNERGATTMDHGQGTMDAIHCKKIKDNFF